MKSKVYSPRPATLVQLQANIQREVAALDPAMLLRSLMDVRLRCFMCITANWGMSRARQEFNIRRYSS